MGTPQLEVARPQGLRAIGTEQSCELEVSGIYNSRQCFPHTIIFANNENRLMESELQGKGPNGVGTIGWGQAKALATRRPRGEDDGLGQKEGQHPLGIAVSLK